MIRMPEGMRDRIKAHAEAGGRSMNMQIVYMLESALFQADYTRLQSGLEPLGNVPEDELDRMHLFIEDNERKAAKRTKVLTEQGMDEMLAAINERVARIEAALAPPEETDHQVRTARKNRD
jgi:hypothetical protein